ncbi:MAG: tRNA-dihydrouridine synthase [Microgenomates group bacterium GW2011_GWB1_40_9]|uniref:tRNA-dihydrouridine synthase n=1 Tax=Candidatus Roizmanbacteria bacterium GW2011_GWC2_41_7 TaxID=1618487 RepID=A0A0G0ZEJ9_9BACT|nr:MAG: Dihydrouridine synthase family protein [Microgenomates group bacterium GW2011_GWC1_39_12]KKR79938.1 MAG: tRNA-dihydrouridine synthase [Microgenomates group bacterium GW2011_GWB1_40_9]KKS20496.1 MAG: tRNA-dihydrouridine synthase [Candidatus Roizmanbacteria bacterium GW2011_GWC2_41_7]
MESFWQTIKKPIIGLSPMDGITDPAFRSVVDEIGHPSILYTEFVSAEGLSRNPKRLLRTFTSHKTDTPLIGQLFGSDPIAMQEAAAILIEKTKIQGIDINMGCPARRVASHGGGAGLIKKPHDAIKLIEAVKSAIRATNKSIGLSVKTRIGYDEIVTETWIKTLLEAQPDTIALHGRTLKQMYTGVANWEEIHKASLLTKKAHILLLGNGDIQSLDEANEHIKKHTPDGILIGRGALGNPWIFQNSTPSVKIRIQTAMRHIQLFDELTPIANPLSLRKHLGWYIKGFSDASSIRNTIMKLATTKDMLDFLSSLSYSE